MKQYTLSSNDLKSIGVGLLKAAIGAALTYLSSTITKVDFGTYTPFVVVIFSMVANSAWKILDGVKA